MGLQAKLKAMMHNVLLHIKRVICVQQHAAHCTLQTSNGRRKIGSGLCLHITGTH